MDIGEEIITDGGTGKIVAASIQGYSDTCINLYLVDFGDHNEVVAQDNATNWVVGDEYYPEMNHGMIETIGVDRLEDFAETVVKHHDEYLAGWILDRINDAKDFKICD